MEKRVARATGLQVGIGPGSWSPWGGLVLRDVVLRLPGDAGLSEGALDVLKVERIVVRLRWARIMRGHLRPERVEVVRPDANVPVELLMALAGKGDAAGPPAAPVEFPALAGENGVDEPAPTWPLPTQGPAGQGSDAAASASPPQAGNGSEEKPTAWLVVRGGRLRSGMGGDRNEGLVLDGIDAEIPLRGKAATGSVRIARFSLGEAPLGKLEIPLSWEAPRLTADHWQPELVGIRSSVSLQIIPQGDFPFMAAFAAPEQALDIGSQQYGAVRIRAARFAAIARLAGYARAPSSWRGNLGADAEDVEAAGLVAQPLTLHRCSLRAVLRGSVVRVADARAVGEQLSMLGNGLIFADGRITALVRIVLPEEAAQAAAEKVARVADWKNFAFHPLETPDRWFFDFPVGGDITNPLLLIPGREPVPLRDVESVYGQR